jgi:hypothetical protein
MGDRWKSNHLFLCGEHDFTFAFIDANQSPAERSRTTPRPLTARMITKSSLNGCT